jgi:hypothetical protein
LELEAQAVPDRLENVELEAQALALLVDEGEGREGQAGSHQHHVLGEGSAASHPRLAELSPAVISRIAANATRATG